MTEDTGPPPLHFRGVVLGPSGFAAEGREWLAALEAAGLQPSLEGARLGDLECDLTTTERALIERCAARRRREGGITFHHMLVPHFAPDPSAAGNWLSTVFETQGLPEGWAERADRAQLVLVKTEWCRQVFARGGLDTHKLVALPPPIDASGFEPAPWHEAGAAGRPMRWLSVFDWTLRKGWDVMLRAFAECFDEHEAELVLKIPPHRTLSTADIQQLCGDEMRRHASRRPPRVRVVDAMLDRSGLATLYATADAFVLASRGEGWGRPVHEALLMELPVVATGASALSALIPDDRVGFPVAARERPVPADAAEETPWFRGQVWFEPDAGDLVRRMREVHDDQPAARRRARDGRRHILTLCDRARVASALRALAGATAALHQRA